MISTAYYKVGTGIYFNKFRAFYESQISSQPLDFNLYENEFDQIDWSEPRETWDQLLDLRAQQIASLGKPIILSFSGGTDSYTVYQVFRRNKIPIRAIHTRIKKDSRFEPDMQKVMDFFRTDMEDLDCQIFVSHDDEQLLDSWYDSPNWVIDRISRHQFTIFSESQPLEYNHWVSNNLGDDYIQVSGLEKPRIDFRVDGVFSYQEDSPFLMRMGDPRYVGFFISPDFPQLHVKQSYMLARYIIDIAQKYQQTPRSIQDIENLQRINYLNYAMLGCGRFGDLANSHQQKILNRGGRLIIPNNDIDQTIIYGRAKHCLEEGIRNRRGYAINYLKGLLGLREDPVMRNIFRDPENYYSVIDLRSKSYRLVDFKSWPTSMTS